MPKLKVIDFFCGAGGFSEGFKQMGFEIVKGYDNWKPAIDTYNHNFGLNCETKNILDFENSIEEINKIPDTEIILGSPPCVSFSSSNKSGKADKSLGVKLTETFLRIVAVKKHKPNSILKAWFMENVVNSKRFLQTEYTFKDLGLSDWANSNKISPNKIAINLYENTTIVNSADYGSIQARKRVISGEILKKKKLIIPSKTHRNPKHKGNLPIYRSIKELKNSFPNPYERKSKEKVSDVNYNILIPKDKITDHFYDTGVYKVEWKFSKFWKQNHPYMGRMSFPENNDNPSRTITATKIANSRESIIYKSEIRRKGNGEYRLPTVREAALIMGFPITYQFLGSENTKWRLVGNAVCCPVSRALAKTVIDTLKLEKPTELVVDKKPNLKGVKNLNNYKRKKFDKPPVKKKGARFRRHPIKDGNLTVTLSNYDIDKNSKTKDKWFTSIQYGTGEGFPIQKVKDGYFVEIEELIAEFKSGKKFLNIINNGFTDKIGTKYELQEMYEKQVPIKNLEQPTELVDQIQEILDKVKCPNILFEQNGTVVFTEKTKVPLKQLFSLYAINKISTIANHK